LTWEIVLARVPQGKSFLSPFDFIQEAYLRVRPCCSLKTITSRTDPLRIQMLPLEHAVDPIRSDPTRPAMDTVVSSTVRVPRPRFDPTNGPFPGQKLSPMAKSYSRFALSRPT
jgi:hypothetical protein